MAARRHWRFTVRDQFGFVIQNAKVFVYQPGTTTDFTGTCHNAASGGSVITNPFTTNSQGEAEGWFDNAQVVDVFVTDNSGAAFRAAFPTVLAPFTSFTEKDDIYASASDTPLEKGTTADLADITAAAQSEVLGASNRWADGAHVHGHTALAADPHGSAAHSQTLSVNPHGIADHTDVTRFLWLPVHDGVVLDGGTLASRGTAPDIIRVITLADAATAGASWAFLLPDDYVTNSSLSFEIYHAGQTTTSGSVRWSTNMHVIAEGVSIVTAQGSAAFTGQAPTTADLLVIEATQALGVTGVAGDLVRVNVRRLGGDGADNYAASTSLIGLKVSYTGSQ